MVKSVPDEVPVNIIKRSLEIKKIYVQRGVILKAIIDNESKRMELVNARPVSSETTLIFSIKTLKTIIEALQENDLKHFTSIVGLRVQLHVGCL